MNCVNQKPPITCPPFVKEMPPSEYSHLNIFNGRVMKNVQGFPDSVLCSQECNAYKEAQKEPESNPGRPDKDQLDSISKVLVEDLPNFFVKPLRFHIYHPDIIFENNIKGIKTKGVGNYSREMTLLKIIGHIKFAHLKFKILKITAHPEDGTVRIRWRITGISTYKAFFSFLKYFTSGWDATPEGWYDGFSIYFIRSDGLVHKHTLDKMIPDSEEKVSNLQNNLAAKMAFAVGITIKSFSPDLLSCEGIQENHNNTAQVIQSQRVYRTFPKSLQL